MTIRKLGQGPQGLERRGRGMQCGRETVFTSHPRKEARATQQRQKGVEEENESKNWKESVRLNPKARRQDPDRRKWKAGLGSRVLACACLCLRPGQ